MIPIRDENPTAHTAFATIGFIALNCYAWVTAQGLGAEIPLVTSVCELGLIPAELTGALPPDTPLRLGEHHCISGGNSLANVFSSMFMHGGWGHILGNLWFLWIFGDNVEDAMGPVRFTVFYLMCGVAAALAQVASNPQSAVPMVGASGAIGGVMGAYIRLYPRAHIHMFLFFGFFFTTAAVPAWLMLGYWFGLQLLGGLPQFVGEGGVAFWAHVGGFVAGAVTVRLFEVPGRLAEHRRMRPRYAARYRL
ncbi:MAG: rhomboid family intramembrane serine protease [Myxococcota bacterium]|nr:rhomboid family intramembrane serine protease [Myxococcota bacterium]